MTRQQSFASLGLAFDTIATIITSELILTFFQLLLLQQANFSLGFKTMIRSIANLPVALPKLSRPTLPFAPTRAMPPADQA